MTSREGKKSKTKRESKKPSFFKIDLREIPNGNLKPKEFCDFLQSMRNWRQKSAHSNILLQ
jgi:hypothetical protein